MHDIKRVYTEAVRYLLKKFPCVAVLGARQTGKTTLIKQILPEAMFFDLEKESDYQRINNDPLFFLDDNKTPLILDEAQLCPRLFSALRVKIDKMRDKNGQYLISGSSSQELLKNISESLAGRIAFIELGTFHLEEAWGKKPSEFYSIIENKKFNDLKKLKKRYSKEQLYDSCLYGGYPEPFLKRKDFKYYELWMENYFQTYINRDIRRLFPTLNIDAYKKFINMLAFSSNQIINFSNFAKSLDVSQPTVKKYFEIAEGTFLWRSMKSYEKNTLKRIIKMPKGFIRDTGIINHILQIKTTEQLKAHPLFGNIWEMFIIEQIIKSFKSNLVSFNYYYYRTHNQAEVDLILEGDFGLIPIEIKSGSNTLHKQLLSLNNFVEEHKCPLGILINNGESVFNINNKIIQIPANYI